MKSIRSLLLTASLALAAALPCAAQTYKTATMSLPWTSVTTGGSSNVLGFGNASGITVATPYEFVARDRLPGQQSWTALISFTIATNGLAETTFVFSGSNDGTNFINSPAQCLQFKVPISAASAGNSNYIALVSNTDTNLHGKTLPPVRYLHLVSTTNNNGVTLTLNSITIRELY